MELSEITMVNALGVLTILNTYEIVGIKQVKDSLLFEMEKN
jgi:hypothetical protein